MRHFSLLAVTAATVIAVGSTASAQGRGSHVPTAPVTSHASTGGGKPTGVGKPTTSPASAKGGGSKKPGSTTTSGESTTTTADTTTTVVAEANAISTKIANNPSQLAKVTALLDGTGMTLEEASAGFRNQGQFLAALNVAKNRNLSFAELQQAMTVDGLSLGQAAKTVPSAQATETTETTTTVTVTTGTEGTTATGTTGDTSTSTSTTTPPAAQ